MSRREETPLPELTGLFDTHAHPTDNRFDEDREALLASMRERGMLCVCVGADMESSAASVELARREESIYASVGVHPHDAKAFTEDDVPVLTGWLTREPKVVALGEIGLDYYYDLSPRDVQKDVFARQLDLAYELDKPAILHIREAHGDTTDILLARARAGRMPRGVMHCYTGSWESAKTYLNLGLYISFSGALTFKNAPKLWEVAEKAPLDRLLIETDCPYMAPVPLRGQRNEPAYIAYVCRKLAELREIDEEAAAEATFENGLRVFGLNA